MAHAWSECPPPASETASARPVQESFRVSERILIGTGDARLIALDGGGHHIQISVYS